MHQLINILEHTANLNSIPTNYVYSHLSIVCKVMYRVPIPAPPESIANLVNMV